MNGTEQAQHDRWLDTLSDAPIDEDELHAYEEHCADLDACAAYNEQWDAIAMEYRARCADPYCTIAKHDAIRADDARWSTLPVLGYQRDVEDPAFDLEMRTCSCGSTLCRFVGRKAA
jgi:hypothetical protein